MKRCLLLLLVLLWLILAHPAPCLSADQMAFQTLNANGVKVFYFLQGQGEPVVLIHGWLSSAGINWVLPGISAKLAKDFQVIAPDVRGHGLSDKPIKEESYGPELVEDIVRLLDRHHISEAHIVGYSMGSIVAASFMVKHPERVLSGTLSGMGWLQAGSVAQWDFAQIGKADPNAQALAICGRSLAKLALTEKEIKSIEVPVTILVGAKDDFVKKLYVEPLRRIRHDWPVVEIEGADHFTCILKPEFRDALADWLRKNARARQR
jgi:pimeloyl-ACP methyl ester carboxylesterase